MEPLDTAVCRRTDHGSSKARRRIAVLVVVYAALWVAVVFLEKLPESVLLKLPPFLVGIVAGILGPPLLLVWGGVDAWMFVVIPLSIATAFLLIARFSWRRYPESELFGLPLLGCVVVWIGSVWFAIAVWGI